MKKTLTQTKRRALINALEKCQGKLVAAGFKLEGFALDAVQDAQRKVRAAIDKLETIS